MTQIKWKYFTDKYTNIPENIEKLREKFPNHVFKNGIYNGVKGTYIISSSEKGINEYDKAIKSKVDKGMIFFPPLVPIVDKQKFIDSFEIKKNAIKSIIKLESGIKLKIIPATAEPKKVALSLFEDDEDDEVAFVSEYGKLAYEIDDKLYNEKEVTLLDGLKLFTYGLSKSYNIPLDLFNYLNVVSSDDIEKLTYSCLGYELDESKKKEE